MHAALPLYADTTAAVNFTDATDATLDPAVSRQDSQLKHAVRPVAETLARLGAASTQAPDYSLHVHALVSVAVNGDSVLAF